MPTAWGSSTTDASSPRERPPSLKAEIGRPCVHAIPCRKEDRPQIAELLAGFGEPLGAERDLAVRLREGVGLADVIRAMDTEGVVVDDVELRAPTLDDVFLAKTGRTLEGAAAGDGGAPAGMSALPTQVGALASALHHAYRASACECDSAADLPGRASARQLGRAQGIDRAARGSPRTRSSPSRLPCRSSRGRSSRP